MELRREINKTDSLVWSRWSRNVRSSKQVSSEFHTVTLNWPQHFRKQQGKTTCCCTEQKNNLEKSTSERPSWLISFFLSLHISSFFPLVFVPETSLFFTCLIERFCQFICSVHSIPFLGIYTILFPVLLITIKPEKTLFWALKYFTRSFIHLLRPNP